VNLEVRTGKTGVNDLVGSEKTTPGRLRGLLIPARHWP
jgi:hypothetical protein